MKKKSSTRSAFFNLRALLGITLCFLGLALAILAGRYGPLPSPRRHTPAERPSQEPERYMPVPGVGSQTEAARLAQLEQYWHDRLTFPTGRFNPAWVRAAAAQHARMATGIPTGLYSSFNPASPFPL